MSPKSKAVPNAREFYPLNEPAIGATYTNTNVYPQNKIIPALFRPLTIRGVTFKNRIFVSPMCQYSSDNGHATDWHFVHIGGFATRGAAGVCMEATAVLPEGRISPEDAGLWADSQIEPLKRIVDFVHAHDTKIGIQLAHAGRKASTVAPWVYTDVAHTFKQKDEIAREDAGGWPNEVYGPSDIPWSEEYPVPKSMTEKDMKKVEDAFLAAVERAKVAGFDFIEIHGAHGYLIHSWLSPLSNVRTDSHGGQPLENRMAFPLRIISRCRAAWDNPLFVRVSATDWAEGPERDTDGKWRQWGIEQTKAFTGEMQKIGVDLVDCSSGGNWAKQKIPVGPGFQVPFAADLKATCPDLLTGVVGLITDPAQANSYIEGGKTDVVFLAREMLRSPNWPLVAAQELGIVVKPASQYERAWTRMLAPKPKARA